MTVNLSTTQEQFETLHEAVNGKAKSVRVDAEALSRLLVDHAALVREGKAHGLKITEPRPVGRVKANLR